MSFKKNIYLNIDSDTRLCPFINKVLEQRNFSEEMLYPFVDVYRATQVTDILFNTFCQISMTPTNCFDSIIALCDYAKDNNIQDDFINKHYGYYKLYCEHNVDLLKIWIERSRENKQKPWISIRMNDCHSFQILQNGGYASFYKTALANDWILGDDYGYYKSCYNYRIKEVRDKMLFYIKEQLERYDVYGIELDFMREIQCFRYLTENMNECIEIMNDFIADIKKTVSLCEQLHGHSIKIAVRLMRDIVNSKYYGFDAEAWVKHKLVDIIIPTSRWGGSDSGIPVAKWKEALPDADVTAGIEVCVNKERSGDIPFAFITEEIARGLAAGYLSSGSDGLYFYNYFVNPLYRDSESYADAVDPHYYIRDMSVLSGCADSESIYKYPVRFVLIPQADESFAGYPSLWKPLPAPIGEEERSFEITTGKIPFGKRVSVIIGIKNSNKNVKVSVNGEECVQFNKIDLSFIPGIGIQNADYVSKETKCYMGSINSDVLLDLTQNISIKSESESTVLTWLELVVI